jgi:hypothetical protein
VRLLDDLGGATREIYDLLSTQLTPAESDKAVTLCRFVGDTFRATLNRILEVLAGKEGRKTIDIYATQYSKDSTMLAFKILYELLAKEARTDFVMMLSKDVFLKSVFICAIECVFCINIVKQISINETLELV